MTGYLPGYAWRDSGTTCDRDHGDCRSGALRSEGMYALSARPNYTTLTHYHALDRRQIVQRATFMQVMGWNAHEHGTRSQLAGLCRVGVANARRRADLHRRRDRWHRPMALERL